VPPILVVGLGQNGHLVLIFEARVKRLFARNVANCSRLTSDVDIEGNYGELVGETNPAIAVFN
jgi:hypothetical protein